jgi:hypothetical protein
MRRVNRYSREELREHLTDYPWSPAGAISHNGQKAFEGLGQAGSGDTAVACQAD